MSFIGSLTKSLIDIAVTPIEVVKDVVTLGGSIMGENEPYTVQRLKKAARNAEKAYDDID